MRLSLPLRRITCGDAFRIIRFRRSLSSSTHDVGRGSRCAGRWIEARDVESRDILENVSVVQEVITERESQLLVSDCEKKLKRRRYEDGHWDGVIHSFREVTAVQWSAASLEILEKVKSLLTQSRPELDGRPFLPPHVLDLSAEGYIRPHVDSVIASGDVVAGLSLLSTCVMRLTSKSDDVQSGESGTGGEVDLLLRPRSFYVLSGPARYDYAHAILPGPDVTWDGEVVSRRERRLSVVFRDALPVQASAAE